MREKIIFNDKKEPRFTPLALLVKTYEQPAFDQIYHECLVSLD